MAGLNAVFLLATLKRRVAYAVVPGYARSGMVQLNPLEETIGGCRDAADGQSKIPLPIPKSLPTRAELRRVPVRRWPQGFVCPACGGGRARRFFMHSGIPLSP
jgi:hypothetical protein